jgi:enoyl-CoA hydratase
MPEADIGLFPDVGAGWYLAHLPGETGLWMALTGARLRGADCVALGLATHFVESVRTEDFKAALVSGEGIEAALGRFASDPGAAPVEAQRADIDRHFGHETVEAIVASLQADGSEWAQAQLAAIARKCPTTHKVSLREIREGGQRATFADEMAAEYRIAVRMVHRHDFIEGVRAVILDKDNAPRWDPAALEDVSEAMVDELFAELPSDEEWTPFPAA